MSDDRNKVASGFDATVSHDATVAEPSTTESTLLAPDHGAPGLADLPTRDPARYVHKREIARGGMGRIVAAYDRELGRELAIKELLTSSPALERRFEREIYITARLQHPSIISVLEAGRWQNGEPFFTMQKVAGRAFDEVIRERKTLAERLSLLPNLIAVCDAMAYAHSQHIVHRDLKPANVLAGAFGETVVIDWGLAKDLTSDGADDDCVAAPQSASDHTVTVIGEAMGTPAYMPPEQARGDVVDERADVYSLGAMLYHVLAGEVPYRDSNPHSAEELLSKVKDAAPTSLRTIEFDTPADLLTIVDKAMARDPAKRYANAGALAEELKRFETGQLVSAHNYSTAALLWRWVKRHRAPVLVAVSMFGVLVAGGALSVNHIMHERDRAEKSRAEAEELTGFMLEDLRDKLEPIGELDILNMVAEKAAAYYARRPLDWARPQEVYHRVVVANNLGSVRLDRGQQEEALKRFQSAIGLLERLTREHPEHKSWRGELSWSHGSVGGILEERGDLDGALRQIRESADIDRQLAKEDPEEPEWQASLFANHSTAGRILAEQGDLDGALAQYRAGLVIAEREAKKHPEKGQWQADLAYGRGSLGSALSETGKSHAALEQYQLAHAILAPLTKKSPENSDWQRDLARNHEHIAAIFLELGEAGTALQHAQAGVIVRERLSKQEPDNAQWQRDLANGKMLVAAVLDDRRQLDAALLQWRGAAKILTPVASRQLKNRECQGELASAHLGAGNTLRNQGSTDAARASYRASMTVFDRMSTLAPGDTKSRRILALTLLSLGATGLTDDKTKARALLRRSVALFRTKAATPIDFVDAARALALLGETDRAFERLDKFVGRPRRLEQQVDLESLRSDPRWAQTLQRLRGGAE